MIQNSTTIHNTKVTISLSESVKRMLSGYPLQYANIDKNIRQNNLNLYKNVTRSNGPAMTWSMHAIGYLDIGMTPTERLFNRTHAPYLRKPFYVWNERANGAGLGASNFLTGAGGFLQTIMYGYEGIRIKTDSMTITRPTLPPRTTQLKLNGMRSAVISIRIRLENMYCCFFFHPN